MDTINAASNREDIRRVLTLDDETFDRDFRKRALEIRQREFEDTLFVSGLLAFSSYCVNDCTYCGLRRSNAAIPRYRLSADEIIRVIDSFSDNGIRRIFLVSGEDRGYPVEDILRTVDHAHTRGLHVTLGCGVYDFNTLLRFREAGADCYTIKFESSDSKLFHSAKPTADFDRRMECIHNVKRAGMELGSGNIIGLAGQTLDILTADIMLMRDLAIDWAPVVPYLPAPGTPMAADTPMGDVALTLRVLSILRLMMPRLLITAGQPSPGSKLGFADPDGNRAALAAGANLLFVDMTPHAVRKDFDITPGRVLPGLAHIDRLLESAGLRRG